MDHTTWMQQHNKLSALVEAVRARRDELARVSEYIPGPVLRTRDRVLDRLELDLLDQLAELVELDRAGAVS